MIPHWLILALLAPFFWSCAGYIDKFVVTRYFRGQTQTGVGSLVIFTGLTGFLMAFCIVLLGHTVSYLSVVTIFWILLAGAVLVASFIPYLHALQREDASVVVPLFQMIPVFSYILGSFVLNEVLTPKQLVASGLVIVSACFLATNPRERYRFNPKLFWLMALASFGIALNSLMFKYLALQNLDPWATGFWEYVGAGLFALTLLLFSRTYRQQFYYLLTIGGVRVGSLNVIGEMLNLSAKLAVGFATLTTPLALVWVVNGLQPLMILLMGFTLTTLFPAAFEEKTTLRDLTHRSFTALTLFIGIYLLLT